MINISHSFSNLFFQKLFAPFLSLLLLISLSFAITFPQKLNADHYCTISTGLIYCPKHNSYAATSADYEAALAVVGGIILLALIIDAGSSSSNSYFISEEEEKSFSPSDLLTGFDVVDNDNFKLNIFKIGEEIDNLKNKENIDLLDTTNSARLFRISYSF
mgnify:CR=1 FL=1|tara:strand:- start:43 stop:522 length:480 start_codon:yes stop_codon:yes gene_type:complete